MRHIQLSVIIVALAMGSCANPTSVVNDDAEAFLREFPSHRVKVAEEGRARGYSWTGDPMLRPVVFVHGSPGSWRGWAGFLMNEELRKKFQIIAVDRPGYGGSGEGRAEISVEKQADAVMKALEINRSGLPAILVGHSYGGPVVAQAAMSHSGQVAGVLFVASSVDPALEKTKWYQYPAKWWPFRWLIPDDLRVCNEEIFALKNELLRMSSEWKSVQAKVVLIQGEDDTLVPPANLDFLSSHLRAERLVGIHRVPGLNHFVPWKRPDLIVDGIRELESAIVDQLVKNR